MQARHASAPADRGVQGPRQPVRAEDRLETNGFAKCRRDLRPVAVPPFAFAVQRLEEQHAATRLDRVGRIQQQHCPRLVNDAGEVLEVRVRSEQSVAVLVVASHDQADGVVERLKNPLTT